MGRFTYDSPRVAATSRTGSSELVGSARCRVYVMKAEENTFGPDHLGSMRHLRERLTREGELVARAPSPALRSEDVVIPRHVFDGLEDAALVNLQWEFFPGRDDET